MPDQDLGLTVRGTVRDVGLWVCSGIKFSIKKFGIYFRFQCVAAYLS